MVSSYCRESNHEDINLFQIFGLHIYIYIYTLEKVNNIHIKIQNISKRSISNLIVNVPTTINKIFLFFGGWGALRTKQLTTENFKLFFISYIIETHPSLTFFTT